MTGNPRNFTDKSMWNPRSAGGINNVNVATVGEVNSFFQNLSAPSPVTYGSQQDVGKRMWIGSDVVADYTDTAIGTLYGGVYQLVLVDSGATAANVAIGHAAYLVYADVGTWGVTDFAHADAASLPAGVFLNTITPGNYGFICVAGIVNVKYKASSLTNSSLAVGDVLLPVTGGVFDDPTQTGNPTWANLYTGFAVAIGTVPVAGALSQARLNLPFGLY